MYYYICSLYSKNIIGYILWAKHWIKIFIEIVLFNSQNNLIEVDIINHYHFTLKENEA